MKNIRFLKFFDTGGKIHNFFYIGVFLLPSAPAIGTIFLLLSSIKGLILKKNEILKDRWNYFLFFSSFFMIISSILNSISIQQNFSGMNNWLGLANWLPLFVCYIGFKPYLEKIEQRKTLSKVLIAGSIPVLVSGICQYFFNLNGPFQILNGLIIWYQRPINLTNGLTGLFNNANYMGCYLTLIWPFCLYELKVNKSSREKFNIFVIFSICLVFSMIIFLTNSRGAWLGYLIAIPIVMGFKNLKWLLPTVLILFLAVFATFMPFVQDSVQIFFQQIIPEKIWIKFSELFLDFQEYPRLSIWQYSIKLILQKPLFGWGADSFPYLYEQASGNWNGHAHNLILDLAVSYGLPVAFLISSFMFGLIGRLIISLKTLVNISNSSRLINKAWLASSLIFFISHLYDVQYFDLRISMIIWITFSGLRNINKEIKNLNIA